MDIQLSNNFLFSIVMPVYNTEKYLDEAILSVINQSVGFHNVQLILVDDGSTDSSKDILLKYQKEFPDNILVLSQKNQGQASARNLGLQYVKGKYVNFLDSDDFLSKNALEDVIAFFNENAGVDIVTIPIQFVDRENNVTNELNVIYSNSRIIDLFEEPNTPLISVSSVFFNYDIIKKGNYSFDSLKCFEDSLFINKLLLEYYRLGIVNSAYYYYRKRFDFDGIRDSVSFSDYFYIGRFDDFYKKLIDLNIEIRGNIADFIQYFLLYDLKYLFINSHLPTFLNCYGHEKFLENVHNILKNINEDYIINNEFLDNDLKELFLFLKKDDARKLIGNIFEFELFNIIYKHPKVSIIIPVYNVEKYLEECLDSVVSQSLKDIEIICINDGSTDSSLEILNNYAKADSRIKIISKENEGQGVARNIGINEATGEYIGFVDSDDYIDKDMFKELYFSAVENDLDICMCHVTTFDESNNSINDDDWYYTLKCFDGFDKKIFYHMDTKDFIHEVSVTPYNKIYKRELLIDNNIYFPRDVIFEDEVFYYDSYLKAKKISIVPKNLYVYRINREGSTVSFGEDNDFIDIVTVFKLVRNVFKKNNLMDIYKKNIYNKFMHYCLLRYSQTSYKYKPKFWSEMKNDFENIIGLDVNPFLNYYSIFNSSNVIVSSEYTLLSNYMDSADSLPLSELEPRIKERVIKILSCDNFEDFNLIDSNKIFSIVMAVYNTEKYLDEAISSVINQSMGFIHNVQLILVDDGSTDSSKDILLKYQKEFPDNILVLSQKNQGQASARNLGLQYVKGRYVNFLDSDDYFSYNVLKDVYEFFTEYGDKTDVVSLPLVQFGRVNGPHLLNYKFSKTRLIDLVKEPNNPQLHISSSFIDVNALEGISFPTTFMGSEDSNVLCKVLLKKKNLGVISTSKYFYRRRDDFSSTLDIMIRKHEHYTPRLKFHFLDLIGYSISNFNEFPLFLQYSFVYDIQWILNMSNSEFIFDNEFKINEFRFLIEKILKYIDDSVIIENNNIQNNNIKNYIYSLKHGKKIIFEEDNVILKTNDIILDQINIHKIWLDIVEIKDNHLIISGLFNSLFNRKNISIIAKKSINDDVLEIIPANFIEYSTRLDNSFLLDIWQYNSNFDIKIPVNIGEQSEVELFVCYHKNGDNSDFNEDNLINFNLMIDFNKFCTLSKNLNYIVLDDILVSFNENTFHIYPYSFKKMYLFEQSILKRFKANEEKKYSTAYKIRTLYLILYPFVKILKRFKSIYLFSDRIKMGGDNAEQLFNYAISQKDSNIKYFAIDGNSADYNRLNGKNIVKFHSLKHRLLYLFADKIISSHPDEDIINPFFNNFNLYSNLFSFRKYFLQHGVTKDDISSWLRKYDKNISLITTVSIKEQKSFFNSKNGYDDEIVQVLGFPRYDKLNNENIKKQILIMPTWINEKMDETKFKSTSYFKKLNELFNDVLLFRLCEKYDYDIIFKPHPMLLDYLKLFDIPEHINVDFNQTYAQLFNESSLLITDYSSVSFDFAYLKKPVIYYQYYKYYNFDLDNSYFKYDSLGFGDVIKDKKDLLDKIEFYLANNCMMEKKFVDRVNNFFEYTDKKNSERNYDWINEH